jgi:hypothetical protein
MISGGRYVAGPIPTKNLDPFSLKFPAGQCGLVLIVHPPPQFTADLLIMQEGEVRTAARLTDHALIEVPVVPPQVHFEQCAVYLFQLPTGSCRDLQYILRSAPTLVLPYHLDARRFTRSALRRLPPRPTLVEHRSWRRGMPSLFLVQCQAPLEFLDRVPPLPSGELRLYDFETNRRIQTMSASLALPPRATSSTPETAHQEDPLAQKLWSAFKRIMAENLGSRAKVLAASLQEERSPDSLPAVLQMMDQAIARGPLFKRNGLRAAARELINDLYSRHAGALHQAGLTENFQGYFAKWKGA